MDGVTRITERISAAAAAEIEKIKADAAAEIEKIEADSAEKVKAIQADGDAAVARERAEAAQRAESAAAAAKRAVTLACRAEVLEDVYAKVRASLAAMDGKEREDFLAGVLRAALADCHAREAHAKDTFGENIAPKTYTLRLSAADTAAYGEALVQSASEPIVLGDAADIDGGLLLVCGDTFINCSLEMILRDAREKTEPQIRAALFG